jgi:type I restriction enzyme S subunit
MAASSNFASYRLGDVLKVKHGKSQKEVADDSGPYPIIGSGGEFGYASEFLHNKPSVLIGRKGTIDRPMFMDSPFWVVDTMFYTEIFKGFDPKYIFYLFQSIDWRSKNEASGVPSLSGKIVEEIEVRIPDYQTQRTIAKALSDTEKLIEVISQLINKKAEIFEGALQAEFSESSGAILTSVSDICDVSKGAAVKYDKDFIQGSFGFLNGGINFSGLTEFSNDSGDTVVVSEGGNSCGFVNYIPAPFWCGGHAYRLLGFPGKQKYLYYALKKSETEIMNLRVGSGLPNIQKKNLSEFQSPIHADPKKQEEVVNFLDSLMGEIAFLKSELAKYECIKQGMAHDLITGKVRLV